MKQEQKCCYCGITEQTIKEFVDNGRLSTKRPTRGLRLELESKNPNKGYDDWTCSRTRLALEQVPQNARRFAVF
jgi:hypothetical protein